MSLTRKLLRELQLTDESIERIIAAHAETVQALKAERDEALASAAAHEQTASERDRFREEAGAFQQEADQLRTELETFRQQVHTERTAQGRADAICELLRRAGANEQALPLLARAVQTTEEDWNGTELRADADVISPVVSQYGAFFSSPVPIPTDRVSPPLDGSALSPDDVRLMSPEEINRNWSQVRSALMQRR
ncbi:MAG: hypothetical protein E7327_00405 [Clostridiales bacterium]|nr:hypothetical protein [Clostridiales bacterium]